VLQPTAACSELLGDCADAQVQPLAEDPDNASVLGERLILKTVHCRKAQDARADADTELDTDPMVELARQLTTVARFPAIPALAGHADYRRDVGPPCTLALLEQFVPNQGSLETRAQNLLRRLSDEHFATAGADAWREDPAQLGFAALLDRLGTRVAELHQALATGNGRDGVDAAFRPEALAAADHERLRAGLQAAVTRALVALRAQGGALPDQAAEAAARLLAAEADLQGRIAHWSRHGFGPVRCRIHGDLRLARVLVAQSEPVLIDAGGPVHRPAAERRAKQPPLKDLGTLVCSLYTTVAELQQRQQAEHPGLHLRLAGPLADWRRDAVERLLAAHAATSAGSPLLPAEVEQRGDLVRLFTLGSALEAVSGLGPQAPPGGRAARLAALVGVLEDAAAPG